MGICWVAPLFILPRSLIRLTAYGVSRWEELRWPCVSVRQWCWLWRGCLDSPLNSKLYQLPSRAGSGEHARETKKTLQDLLKIQAVELEQNPHLSPFDDKTSQKVSPDPLRWGNRFHLLMGITVKNSRLHLICHRDEKEILREILQFS